MPAGIYGKSLWDRRVFLRFGFFYALGALNVLDKLFGQMEQQSGWLSRLWAKKHFKKEDNLEMYSETQRTRP